MKQKSVQSFVALLILGALASCAGKFNSKVDFNPQEPLRIAVLPFAMVNDKGEFEAKESRIIVDNLSLVSKDREDTPGQTVRKRVLIELKRTPLDLLSTGLIDIDLPHHGFDAPNGLLDVKKLYATDPKELCTKFLNCDAILYGKIFRWDRSYYGLQSVNEVGLELTLISARTGKTLFTTRAEDSESRGLTQGPTGYASLVLEPVKGLDSQIIIDLSRRTVAKMLEPLRTNNQPEFLKSEPPSVFGASHDSPTGKIAGSLIVVMMGTPARTASFTIGKSNLTIPMFERSPGHYFGEYVPLPGDSFHDATVSVSLKDQFGRSTDSKIALAPLNFQ